MKNKLALTFMALGFGSLSVVVVLVLGQIFRPPHIWSGFQMSPLHYEIRCINFLKVGIFKIEYTKSASPSYCVGSSNSIFRFSPDNEWGCRHEIAARRFVCEKPFNVADYEATVAYMRQLKEQGKIRNCEVKADAAECVYGFLRHPVRLPLDVVQQ